MNNEIINHTKLANGNCRFCNKEGFNKKNKKEFIKHAIIFHNDYLANVLEPKHRRAMKKKLVTL